MTYSRLTPCRVETTEAGILRFIDPSADWPVRRQRSQPHIDGNATRRAIQRANDPVLRECGR